MKEKKESLHQIIIKEQMYNFVETGEVFSVSASEISHLQRCTILINGIQTKHNGAVTARYRFQTASC